MRRTKSRISFHCYQHTAFDIYTVHINLLISFFSLSITIQYHLKWEVKHVWNILRVRWWQNRWRVRGVGISIHSPGIQFTWWTSRHLSDHFSCIRTCELQLISSCSSIYVHALMISISFYAKSWLRERSYMLPSCWAWIMMVIEEIYSCFILFYFILLPTLTFCFLDLCTIWIISHSDA